MIEEAELCPGEFSANRGGSLLGSGLFIIVSNDVGDVVGVLSLWVKQVDP